MTPNAPVRFRYTALAVVALVAFAVAAVCTFLIADTIDRAGASEVAPEPASPEYLLDWSNPAVIAAVASAPASDVVRIPEATAPPTTVPQAVQDVAVDVAPEPAAPAPVPAATPATFDGGAGEVGTGGATEVQGQGPRTDSDRRLLECQAFQYGDPIPGAVHTVTAFSWEPDYVATMLAAGTCQVVG